MNAILSTSRVRLVPVTAADEAAIAGLLAGAPDGAIRADALSSLVTQSLDPASITALWRIETASDRLIGIAGLQSPSDLSLQLRAIGWRSLEVILTLAPAADDRALARDVLDALAAHAGHDGVTFALVACMGAVDAPRQALFRASGFQELGRIPGSRGETIVFERAV